MDILLEGIGDRKRLWRWIMQVESPLLYKFLGDEKALIMTHLPDTNATQDCKLCNCPPNNARIGQLRLITEFSFTFLCHISAWAILYRIWITPIFTLWAACSRRMSCTRSFKSWIRFAISNWSHPLMDSNVSCSIYHHLPDKVSVWSCCSPAGSSKSISNVIR